MVSDPWGSSRSSAHGDDPLDASAAPTTQDPWATQEQPTVPAPAPESFAPAPSFTPPPVPASSAPAYLPSIVPPASGYPASFGEEPEATATSASPFLDEAPAGPATSAVPAAEAPVDFASLVHELAGAPAPQPATGYRLGEGESGIPDFVINGAAPVPAPPGGFAASPPIPAAPAPPIPAAAASETGLIDATYTVGGTPVPIPPGRYADGVPQSVDAPVVQPAPAGGVPIPPGGPGWAETATIAVGAYEIPAAVERTAVPMPDLEVTSSGERTVVVGRYGLYDFVLRLAGGQGYPVDRPLLLGRRPDALRGPDGARLVVVDDPQRTVSRSHLLAEPRPDGILLRNLSMVNALVLVSPEGDEAEVEPGGAITVTGACSVILGAYPIAVERA